MAKGKRTGGRVKGTPNKTTAEVKAAAQVYTADAIKTLVSIMLTGEAEQARISAAKEILDRGHGRPAQALTDGEGGPLAVISRIIHEHRPAS